MKFKNEKIQSAFDKMEAFFAKFAIESIVAEKQSFKEVKLNDGVTIIRYAGDTPAQGILVEILTEQSWLPIPDGEYMLEDGSTIMTSGGLIAEVIPAGEAPLKDVQPTSETNPVQATDQKPNMENKQIPKRVIKSQVEEHVFSLQLEDYELIKIDLSPMFKSLKDENIELRELNKELFQVVKEISGEPAVAATEKTKMPFNVKEFKSAFKANILKLEKESQKY